MVLSKADRTAIGHTESFQQHDPCALPQSQPGGNRRIRRYLAKGEDPTGWFLVVPADPLAEPRTRPDRIVENIICNEGPASLLGLKKSVTRQLP